MDIILNIVNASIATTSLYIFANFMSEFSFFKFLGINHVTEIKQEDGTIVTYYYDIEKQQKAFKILEQSCNNCKRKDGDGNYCTKYCEEYAKYYKNAY